MGSNDRSRGGTLGARIVASCATCIFQERGQTCAMTRKQCADCPYEHSARMLRQAIERSADIQD